MEFRDTQEKLKKIPFRNYFTILCSKMDGMCPTTILGAIWLLNPIISTGHYNLKWDQNHYEIAFEFQNNNFGQSKTESFEVAYLLKSNLYENSKDYVSL